MGLFNLFKKEESPAQKGIRLYYEGEKDPERRLECWEEASALGNIYAKRELAKLAAEHPTMENLRRAAQLYGEVRAIGAEVPLKTLGGLYEQLGEQENAFSCYLQAADVLCADGDVCFLVGEAYRLGRGTAVDPEQAVYWYEKAAGRLDTDAMLALAQMYLDGEGVEKNWKEALSLAEDAARYGDEEQGNRMAAAICYETGMAQDDAELLRKAETLGSAEAGAAMEERRRTLWKKALEEKDAALMKKAAAFDSIDAMYLLAFDAAKDGKFLDDAELFESLRDDEDPEGELLYRVRCFARYWQTVVDEGIYCEAATECGWALRHEGHAIREALTSRVLRVAVRLDEGTNSLKIVEYLEPLARFENTTVLFDLSIGYGRLRRYEEAKATILRVIELTGPDGAHHDEAFCKEAKEHLETLEKIEHARKPAR